MVCAILHKNSFLNEADGRGLNIGDILLATLRELMWHLDLPVL